MYTMDSIIGVISLWQYFSVVNCIALNNISARGSSLLDIKHVTAAATSMDYQF